MALGPRVRITVKSTEGDDRYLRLVEAPDKQL
jgi:hypothetical protein